MRAVAVAGTAGVMLATVAMLCSNQILALVLRHGLPKAEIEVTIFCVVWAASLAYALFEPRGARVGPILIVIAAVLFVSAVVHGGSMIAAVYLNAMTDSSPVSAVDIVLAVASLAFALLARALMTRE